MARRRYLISYDIADPKRLRNTFIIMKGYGTWLQYSVFLCDLSLAELACCERDLNRTIDHRCDSIVIIDLGPPGLTPIRTMGVPRHLPDDRPVVV